MRSGEEGSFTRPSPGRFRMAMRVASPSGAELFEMVTNYASTILGEIPPIEPVDILCQSNQQAEGNSGGKARAGEPARKEGAAR
jgi:hypothetical protein